jgi:hypothetical protein
MTAILRNRAVLVALVIGCVVHVAAPARSQSNSLKIVVLAGEDAVNVIQQKTAVAPIVEVRDRNDLPVAGATVVFAVNGPGATFAGAQTLTVVTNAAGQATAAGLTPTMTGALRISATATFQGQKATVTIAQSNVMTVAEAAKTARPANTASGGGMSAGKIIAVMGGIGAAGAGVAIAANGSSGAPSSSTSTSPSTATGNTTSPTTTTPTTTTPTIPSTPPPATNNAPVITSATITPNVALIGLDTPITLQVQASDADNDSLTYLWEFPDGSRSDQRVLTRTFQLGGTWNIRVTVSDGRTSTSSQATLEMKTMAGSWETYYFSEPTGRGQLDLVQNGSAITGESFVAVAPYLRCRVAGTVRSASPQVSMAESQCVNVSGTSGFKIPNSFALNLGSDVDTLVGTSQLDGSSQMTAVTLRRKR